ncbi:ADP-ribosylation factor-like protein 9 [Salarias fasciatus]|uniref:ADP-ribosylation factor-like 9 n=1 Tax=Salarias fasciatus TaxID=181472 RepID=A0A672GFI2_SALFA|nr:ADP-ribosylation factor-like protein 9 [Salarias fasciatus]
MSGLRAAGILGASVAAAAGLAYLLWAPGSSSRRGEQRSGGPAAGEPETPAGRGEEEEEEEEEERKEAAREPETPAERREEEEEERSEAAGVLQTAGRPVEPDATQVLVLGLDGAGKSSLLHCFATGSVNVDTQPTQGFNAVSINRDRLHVEFQEIGGKEDLRPYWRRYLSKALLLVFVVDSSAPQLFPEAKKHLHELLSCRPGLPLMLLANKQDLPGSRSITDVHEALSLSDIGERQLFLVGTHVRKGDTELSSGVQDAWELIIQTICGDR